MSESAKSDQDRSFDEGTSETDKTESNVKRQSSSKQNSNNEELHKTSDLESKSRTSKSFDKSDANPGKRGSSRKNETSEDPQNLISSKNTNPSKNPRESDPIPTKDESTKQTNEEQKPEPTVTKKKSLSFNEKKEKRESVKSERRGKEDNKEEESAESDEESRIIEVRRKTDSSLKNERQNRASYMMKTKGKLYYKKKGPFTKWKLFYIVVDDFKMQLNFFKSHEEYENLARCKMSIDLRFVTEVKPQKKGLLQSSYPFKMLRRAGLSTVKLAAFNEEERAKWITMVEGIMKKVKMSNEMDSIIEEKRFSTLPSKINTEDRNSSDSESHTASSAPDQEELIRPKKVSNVGGFKLNTQEISSVKLRRISSEKKDQEIKPETRNVEIDDVFDPKEKFGVNLRRVQTERASHRSEREQSPEYMEFKQKYNSLSLSRTNKSPKLPLNENSFCSHLVENIPREEVRTGEKGHTLKEVRDPNRKRSPSPNIPISKAVESVIKNKFTDDKSESLQESSRPRFNVHHATSTVISYYESSELKINQSMYETPIEVLKRQPDIVSSATVTDKRENKDSKFSATATRPDILKPSTVTPKPSVIDGNIPSKTIEYEDKEVAITISDNECEDEYKETDDSEISNPTNTHNIGNIQIHVPEKSGKEKIENENENENKECSSPKYKTQILINSSTENKENEHIEFIVDNSDKSYQVDTENKRNPTIQCEEDETCIHEETTANTKLNSSDKEKSDSENQTEGKSDSKRVTGIMSQKQIDSIVFGREDSTVDESTNQDNGQELTVNNKRNEDLRSSFHSYLSQVSTESDEPLPKFNFLGKGDRSSSGSISLKEPSQWEDYKGEKLSDSDDSTDQASVTRSKPLKQGLTRPDQSGDIENRTSLVLPEFTVEEENPDELLNESQNDIKNSSPEISPSENLNSNLELENVNSVHNLTNVENKQEENKISDNLKESSLSSLTSNENNESSTSDAKVIEIHPTETNSDESILENEVKVKTPHAELITINEPKDNLEDSEKVEKTLSSSRSHENESIESINDITETQNELPKFDGCKGESCNVSHFSDNVSEDSCGNDYNRYLQAGVVKHMDSDDSIPSLNEEKEEILKEIEYEEIEPYIPIEEIPEYKIRTESFFENETEMVSDPHHQESLSDDSSHEIC